MPNISMTNSVTSKTGVTNNAIPLAKDGLAVDENSVLAKTVDSACDRPKIFIIAGEVSGDQRAAELAQAIFSLVPHAEIKGMGGRYSKAQGINIVVDSESAGAVMGIIEVIRSGKQLLTAFSTITKTLRTWRPDVIILIDFPTFNLRVAKKARDLKIPVLYYVPPKLWASRPSRVRALDRYVHHVATIFPFEKEFLAKHGFYRTSYVGHPFKDKFPNDVASTRTKISSELRRTLAIPSSDNVVSIFPGSRSQEVTANLPILINGLLEARKRGKPITAVIPIPSHLIAGTYELIRPHLDWCIVWQGDTKTVLFGSDIGILKSGTCNLEAAYAGLPFAMVYAVHPISATIIRKLSPLKQFSIVNILIPNTIRELLQDDFTVSNVADEVDRLLTDNAYRKQIEDNLALIRKQLSSYDERDKSENLLSYLSANETSNESKEDAALRVAKTALKLAATKPPLITENRRLLELLRPHKRRFILAILCMVCYGATDGAVPFIVKFALDKVLTNGQRDVLLIFPIILVSISFFRAFVDFGQQYLQNSVGHRVVEDLRNKLHQKLLLLSPSFFSDKSSGDLLARATADVQLVRTLLTDSTSAILRDIVRIIALTFAAFFLDPFLAFIAVIVFPLGIIPVSSFGKKMRRLSRKGQEAIGSLSSLFSEAIHGNKIVKLFTAEDYEQSRFRQANSSLTRTLIRSEKVRALVGPINEVLASIAIGTIIFYGGTTVISGSRTQGDFIAFLLAVFLMYDPFKKLSRVTGALQQGIAGSHRIFEVLDAQVTIASPENPVSMPKTNCISFENISFSYSRSSSRGALTNVTMSIEEGEKIALVGLSGSGKSTLVDLIPRFIDPTQGRLLLGGIDIRKLSLSELRSRIAMVSQHTFLFQDSIFENIRYGRRDATLEDVENAARLAYAYQFIKQLPLGFFTIIGESGMTLSGGERQRIAIARALISKSPILILDEATASLDNSSEREVQKALEVLEKGRTTLVIAHRLSTIRSANRIFVLKDGVVVEIGTHDELMDKDGEYKRLYELQFSASLVSSSLDGSSSVDNSCKKITNEIDITFPEDAGNHNDNPDQKYS
jgi:subfamily B ATP-binding cassette protein MsbA